MSRDGRRKEREEQKRGGERYLSLFVALAFLPPKKLQKKFFLRPRRQSISGIIGTPPTSTNSGGHGWPDIRAVRHQRGQTTASAVVMEGCSADSLAVILLVFFTRQHAQDRVVIRYSFYYYYQVGILYAYSISTSSLGLVCMDVPCYSLQHTFAAISAQHGVHTAHRYLTFSNP